MHLPLKKTLFIFCGLLLFYTAILYFFQNRFIFYPDRRYFSPTESGMPEFTEHNFTGFDGLALRGWYAKGDKNKPAILFFHGNAGQISRFAPQMKQYLTAGYSIFMPEYRGFAGIKGELSQQNIYHDALAAYDYLQHTLGHSAIILFGYSMGTAPASATAVQRHPQALILAAPFYSLASLVAEKPLPAAVYLLQHKLPSNQFIARYQSPLLIIHGRNDELIPPHHGQNLYNLSPAADKTLLLVPKTNHYELYFNHANHLFILNWLKSIYL